MQAQGTCRSCGTALQRTGKRGRPRKWCETCMPPAASGQAGARWKKLNPDHVRAYNAKRRKPEHPCRTCGRTIPGRRQWCEDCAAERQRARHRERDRRKRLDSEYRRIERMRSRGRKAATRNTDLTPAYLVALKDRTHNCPLCGIAMTHQPFQLNSREVDHILPVAAGGTHTIGNVRIVCRKCNNSRPNDGSDLNGWQPTLWAQGGRGNPHPATPDVGSPGTELEFAL